MTFSAALHELKMGSFISRSGWNGKGMWLELVPADGWQRSTPPGVSHLGDFALLPWIGMKTADDKFVPWLASQTDILADDWGVLR